MYGCDYIDKHVMRRRDDPDDAQTTWINIRSGYFINEHGSRVLRHDSDLRVSTIVISPHIVVILTIDDERFHIAGRIATMPAHIDTADDLCVDYTQVGVVSSAMSRRERAVHLAPNVRACNPRPNIITLVRGYTELHYDCTGCIPTRPSIPFARGIRHDTDHVVLVCARRRRHHRHRQRRHTVLLVWDPVTRYSYRIRVHGYVYRDIDCDIHIDDYALNILYTHFSVIPDRDHWPNVYEN